MQIRGDKDFHTNGFNHSKSFKSRTQKRLDYRREIDGEIEQSGKADPRPWGNEALKILRRFRLIRLIKRTI
jgi:hypothetical protein